MLIEVLSDYPGSQLLRTEELIENHRRSAAAHASAVAELRSRHAASRRWWQWAKRLAQRRDARALEARAPVIEPGIHERRAKQEAGVDAEERLTRALAGLSDEWLVFRGYANRRGEIDHLLVGPPGIWAVEVKGRAVHVHVVGDHWSFEKFDRYGNLRGRGVLTDGGGRSWGRQVGEPAAELREFLASRGFDVPVRTAVVVLHERASLGTFESSSVDVISIGTEYLMARIDGRTTSLDSRSRDRIAALVRRDHEFHARRRRTRRGRSE